MWTGSSTLTLNEAFVLRMLRLYIWPGWMKPSSLPLLDSPVQPSIPTFCSLSFTLSTTHGTFCHLQEHKYVFSSFMWHFSYWENNQNQTWDMKKETWTNTHMHTPTHTLIFHPHLHCHRDSRSVAVPYELQKEAGCTFTVYSALVL